MRLSLVLPWLVIALLPAKANASSYILDVNLSPVAGVTSSGSAFEAGTTNPVSIIPSGPSESGTDSLRPKVVDGKCNKQ
jgi:hypothetical protein